MSRVGSSALVNVTEDAELRLVRHLAEAAEESVAPGFVQKCEACIAGGDAAKLMATIVAEKGAIKALSLDEEGVSAVSLLAALLDRAKDSKLVDDFANSLMQASSDATKTVSLLATLFNMRSSADEKVGLMTKMIRFATQQQPVLLEPQASVLGKWMDASQMAAMMDEWNIEPSVRRPLYLAASEGASTAVAQQRFTLLALGTYSSTDLDQESLKISEKAAIGAVRDPVALFEQQRNMLSLPAIQALRNKSAPLCDLLKVFQEGKLEDYNSFLESNGGEEVLKQWQGVTPENCVRYMRILSLCSLAAEHEEIPYHVVANTLQTSIDDVESWVIAAVSSGLLSAKMDQLQNKVVVERCVIRTFDMNQWKAVQSRIHEWKKNVGGILEAYRQSLAQDQQ